MNIIKYIINIVNVESFAFNIYAWASKFKGLVIMKLFAGISREDHLMAKKFTNETGRTARIVLGGTIFELIDFQDVPPHDEFAIVIPEILADQDMDFFIECYDCVKDELSWLSFGVNGERLGPFHVFKNHPSLIALYYSRGGTIQAIFDADESFSFIKLTVEKGDELIACSQELIWTGYQGEPIPSSLFMLEPTIRMAFDYAEIMFEPEDIVSGDNFPIEFEGDKNGDSSKKK